MKQEKTLADIAIDLKKVKHSIATDTARQMLDKIKTTRSAKSFNKLDGMPEGFLFDAKQVLELLNRDGCETLCIHLVEHIDEQKKVNNKKADFTLVLSGLNTDGHIIRTQTNSQPDGTDIGPLADGTSTGKGDLLDEAQKFPPYPVPQI